MSWLAKIQNFMITLSPLVIIILITFAAVADLTEGSWGLSPPPLFWVKKEEITEGRKAGRASKTKPGPLP